MIGARPVLALALIAAGAAFAQDEPVPAVVTSVATGMAEGPAAYAEFTLTHRQEHASAVDALAGARQFGDNVRQSINLKEFKGVETIAQKPAIIRYEPPTAEVSATVRANINALAGDSGGEHGFARLIDELRRIGETLNCSISLPRYVSADEDDLVRRAIQDATERAFAPGDAAAAALRAQVFTVDQIDILGVGFDTPPDGLFEWKPTAPATARCWAKVRVTYLVDG